MKRSESGEMRIEPFEVEMPNKEKIIDRITENGYFTKYPIYISICIFFTFVANGFIVNIFNLIIIPTQQYFQASDFMTEMMAGIIFIGSAIGSGIAGILSEKYGRAKVIKIFSGIMMITYLISTLSFNLINFFISRIILGLTVGVNEPLIFNTFGEYLPTKIRGFLLMNSWLFYTLAVFAHDLLALKIMPNLESEYLQKYLLTLNVFFIINFIVNYFLLYDSPRHLIIKSMHAENFYERETNINEAIKILNDMNRTTLTQVEEQQLVNELYNSSNNNNNNENENKSSFKELFSKKYLKTTLIGTFAFFVFSCGYFGFYIISTLTLEVLNNKENQQMIENNRIEESNNMNSNRDIIISQIFISLFDLAGSLVGGCLAEIKFLGRKGVIWIFMLISAITLIPSYFSVAYYNIFFTISITAGAIYGDMLITYLSEIFPTRLRDTSSSYFLTSYRISGFFSQFLFLALFKLNYKIPFYFGSLLNILGVITIFMLPYEPLGRPLDYEEVVSQKNNNQIEF